MNRTSIEWVKNPDGSPGYTWNPITGCLNHDNGLCKGGGFPCYAYRLAHGRLRDRYLGNKQITPAFGELCDTEKAFADPFYPRFWGERLKDIERPAYPFSDWSNNNQSRTIPIERLPANRHARRKGVGIFTCDMSDLFGIGIPEEWTIRVLDAIRRNSVDRFYLLTKQPQNLVKFSPFPANCYVGVTVTNSAMLNIASNYMANIKASVKYYSFEPLLSWDFKAQWDKDNESLIRRLKEVSWLIIGACTGSKEDMELLCEQHPELSLCVDVDRRNKYTKWMAQPKVEWVREIVEAADKAGISVFLKDNLRPLLKNSEGWTPGLFVRARDSTGNEWFRQEMPTGT